MQNVPYTRLSGNSSLPIGNKIDLVMWTYNSEKNLPAVLQRIQEVIPSKYVNRKIITDDHSTDKTREIALSLGWEVHFNKGKGVQDNTKTAISLVTTPIFCSFEHDIILARDWWEKIVPHFDDPTVVVAQGTRVSTNPVFRVIDDFSNQRMTAEHRSLDNNLVRTEYIRKFGYNEVGTPPILETHGLKWVLDRTIVSDHIRDGAWENIRHDYKMMKISNSSARASIKMHLTCLRIWLTSPIRGLIIAIKQRRPDIFLIYPLDRTAIFIGSLKRTKPLKILQPKKAIAESWNIKVIHEEESTLEIKASTATSSQYEA